MSEEIKHKRYRYIHFFLSRFQSDYSGANVWECRNNRTDAKLGEVYWYDPWKRFCYFAVNMAAVYSADCLRDIADFLEIVNGRKES